MTDVGSFPGGMPTYYRVHLEWVRHAGEAAGQAGDVVGPESVGATIDAFDAAFDPIGPRLREVLEPTFMIEAPEGLLSLTDRGVAELAQNWGPKTDSSFGNVSVTGTLVVTGAATFSSTGSFAGPLTVPTNATTGINPLGLDGLLIDGPATSGAGITGRKAGVTRWRLVLGNNTAEGGSNAGSDFSVVSYSDAGAVIATPLSILRSTGIATFSSSPTAPTPTAGDSSTKLATTAFVATAVAGVVAGGVSSFNTRAGAVVLTTADVIGVGGAPIASPAFTGIPTTASTPIVGDSSTKLATTAFVATAIAPLATSASLPVASSATPLMDGTATIGVGTTWARADHIHPTDTTRYAASNPSGYQTAAQVTAALPVASSTTPLMNSTAAIGVGTTWARADHVHPVDTSRYAASNPSGYQTAAQVTTSLAAYLPLAGGRAAI